MTSDRNWKPRCAERLPDGEWQVTLNRVRGEFHEMPCMRLTPDQAATLLGLTTPVLTWVFDTLESEGFLARTPQGEYTRRNDVL